MDVASRVRNLVEKPIPAASYASRGEFSTSEVLVIAKLRAAAVFVNGEHCMCVGAAAGWKLLERRFRERYWRGGWDAKVRFACWFVCLLVCLLVGLFACLLSSLSRVRCSLQIYAKLQFCRLPNRQGGLSGLVTCDSNMDKLGEGNADDVQKVFVKATREYVAGFLKATDKAGAPTLIVSGRLWYSRRRVDLLYEIEDRGPGGDYTDVVRALDKSIKDISDTEQVTKQTLWEISQRERSYRSGNGVGVWYVNQMGGKTVEFGDAIEAYVTKTEISDTFKGLLKDDGEFFKKIPRGWMAARRWRSRMLVVALDGKFYKSADEAMSKFEAVKDRYFGGILI